MSAINDFLLNLPLPLIDHWGYLILFLAAVMEALPVLGAIIPGHALVIFSGFLAYLGVFRLDAAMLVATLGAFSGDLLAYAIGRRYGHEFITRYGKYFFFNQARYEKVKDLVSHHAGKTLIIGRFSPFARSISAFIAGTSRVKFSKVIFYTIIGAALWAVPSVLVGYIFGQGFDQAAKYFGRFILIAVIAIILIILGYRFLNQKKHIFAKYHILYLTLNGLSIYVFSKMAEDYFDHETTYRFDQWLDSRIHFIWQPWLNKLMTIVSASFSPKVLLSIGLAGAIYFLIKKKWYRSGLIIISLGGGLALGAILKLLVNRPRPLGGLVQETGLSFPSQHAVAAVIFFSLAIFFSQTKISHNWLRRLFILANIFLILLVGFSRVYLKVHWFSDVIAGFSLGLFWLTLLILVFRIIKQLQKNQPN